MGLFTFLAKKTGNPSRPSTSHATNQKNHTHAALEASVPPLPPKLPKLDLFYNISSATASSTGHSTHPSPSLLSLPDRQHQRPHTAIEGTKKATRAAVPRLLYPSSSSLQGVTEATSSGAHRSNYTHRHHHQSSSLSRPDTQCSIRSYNSINNYPTQYANYHSIDNVATSPASSHHAYPASAALSSAWASTLNPCARHVDILDAQGEIRPADFRGRVQASGWRDYGEDVALRNMSDKVLDADGNPQLMNPPASPSLTLLSDGTATNANVNSSMMSSSSRCSSLKHCPVQRITEPIMEENSGQLHRWLSEQSNSVNSLVAKGVPPTKTTTVTPRKSHRSHPPLSANLESVNRPSKDPSRTTPRKTPRRTSSRASEQHQVSVLSASVPDSDNHNHHTDHLVSLRNPRGSTERYRSSSPPNIPRFRKTDACPKVKPPSITTALHKPSFLSSFSHHISNNHANHHTHSRSHSHSQHRPQSSFSSTTSSLAGRAKSVFERSHSRCTAASSVDWSHGPITPVTDSRSNLNSGDVDDDDDAQEDYYYDVLETQDDLYTTDGSDPETFLAKHRRLQRETDGKHLLFEEQGFRNGRGGLPGLYDSARQSKKSSPALSTAEFVPDPKSLPSLKPRSSSKQSPKPQQKPVLHPQVKRHTTQPVELESTPSISDSVTLQDSAIMHLTPRQRLIALGFDYDTDEEEVVPSSKP